MTFNSLHSLRESFQDWLLDWHAAEGGETDFRVLARRMDLKVIEGNRSSYNNNTRTIVIRRGLHPLRERHEGLHEVVHALFRNAKEGAFFAGAATLGGDRLRSRQRTEESIVQEATWQLLIPPERLQNALSSSEDDTSKIVQLAQSCRTSLDLAGRRFINELTRPVRGIVLDSRGVVVASFGNGLGVAKYVPGKDFQVSSTHPLRSDLPFGQAVTFRAAIPFKTSRRYWPVLTEAYRHMGRQQTLALFDGRKTEHQGMQALFPHIFHRHQSAPRRKENP